MGISLSWKDEFLQNIFPYIFFYHRIYLDGKQIFLNKDSIEIINQIFIDLHSQNDVNLKFVSLFKLSTIRKIFGDLIPNDAVFLERKDIIRGEDLYFSQLFPYNKIINFVSPRMSFKKNRELTSFPFSYLKLIEKNKKFNIFEYPQKEENDYYSIIILGSYEDNIKFINGFLNYLFDINEEDSFRLKLGGLFPKEKDNFINKIFISSKKGNFKFNSINIKEINKEDIEQFLMFLKNEKYINLFLLNKHNEFNDFTIYSKDFMHFLSNGKESKELREKDIIDIFLEAEETEKFAVFFSCPNMTQQILKLSFLQRKIKILDKLEIFLKDKKLNLELFKEIILKTVNEDEILRKQFISCFFDYDCIYNINNNKSSFLSYDITMQGYSYFYNIAIDRENIFINISLFIQYFSIIKDKLNIIDNKINNFKEKKMN